MAFEITVLPSQHTFVAEAGETILNAALRQGVLLPYGCGDGACGACRGKVVDGLVEHGAAPSHVLSDQDRAAGVALLCCASARSDLSIEARELPAQPVAVKTLPARVQKLTLAAPDVMLIELKLPPGEHLQFLPGQYIEILLKGGARRAFSLANAPGDDSCLQLHVRHLPGGLFTDQVFSTMKERDMLRLSGPHGSFFLREGSTKPMLLIAGGTGLAPIKAIVEHAIAQRSQRPMAVYWGGRTLADLYLLPLAEQWAAAGVRFVPVLSDAAPGDQWTARSGFVHAAAMADYPDLSGHQVYVCGSPAMVAAVRRDFVAQCQLPENEFFADSFEVAVAGVSSPSAG
jgi:CDP-4-dehydro-6-deoxyglucose reductase